MDFSIKEFEELSLSELYRILQLRQEIFIVEQDCPYLDADDKDQNSIHLLGRVNGKIMGYTRLVPKGISYDQYSSIGRVVVAEQIRNTGAGKMLMKASVEHCLEQFVEDIKISAQAYLQGFYESLGFEFTGEAYLEDGIPHLAMIYYRT